MTMRDFIKQNRAELDQIIRAALDRPEYRLNDNERYLWIINDEGLYQWARSNGVRV